MKEALALLNWKVVNTSVAVMHNPAFVELPIFISVRAEPLPGCVMRLVRETDRDAGASKRPQLFDEPIVQLFLPFASEKLHDLLSSGDKLRAIAPLAVDGISEGDLLRIARVPAVFGLTYLKNCRLLCE